MCNKAVEVDPWQLKDVPDWFVTQEQIDMWYDDDEYCDDDGLIRWYKGYKKCKTQKAKIKEELMPMLGIHQFIGIGACEKMKKETEKL